MLSICTTTKNHSHVQEAIRSVARLEELVSIDTGKPRYPANLLTVKRGHIVLPPDWYDHTPPYLFSPISCSMNNLLALIFFKLGNYQKAFEYLNPLEDTYQHLMLVFKLQYGYPIDREAVDFVERQCQYNLAFLYHYGNLTIPATSTQTEQAYRQALQLQKNSKKIFLVKHFGYFLIDSGKSEQVVKLVREYSSLTVSDIEKNVLTQLLSDALSALLEFPYDERELAEIASLQQECLTYYESQNLPAEAGLLLIKAAEIAGYQSKYSRAISLINRAIALLKQEEMLDFLGEAFCQKGILLYTWSKNGNPQYYKAAIRAYQDALKIFKRYTHPRQHADIQHNLALIYSEMQVPEQEKGIWAAFSASAFKEALQFYTKESHPYEYARIAHNYATALMGFPPARLHDNRQKAFDLFETALEVRTAQDYPLERALTLLNQLELYWQMHNDNAQKETQKYFRMVEKAREVTQLTSDPKLIKQASEHLSQLEKLKAVIS